MLTSQFPFHFFHAHGVAFGAEFTKPFHATIESQAATAISSVGGHAVAHAAPFNFRELVRIGRASTQIAAIQETAPKSFDTVVTCSLQDVNIFNQFTADEIVAHLSVKTSERGEMKFNTIGTRFVNLRVGGVAVTVRLEQECGGREATRTTAPTRPIFDISAPVTTPPTAAGAAAPVGFAAVTPDSKGPNGYLTTLAADVHFNEAPGCIQSAGNAIYVPDFGVIYLAEYLVSRNARQLNMFRIQFGCGVEGRASGGGVGGNGTNCPPPPV